MYMYIKTFYLKPRFKTNFFQNNRYTYFFIDQSTLLDTQLLQPNWLLLVSDYLILNQLFNTIMSKFLVFSLY